MTEFAPYVFIVFFLALFVALLFTREFKEFLSENFYLYKDIKDAKFSEDLQKNSVLINNELLISENILEAYKKHLVIKELSANSLIRFDANFDEVFYMSNNYYEVLIKSSTVKETDTTPLRNFYLQKFKSGIISEVDNFEKKIAVKMKKTSVNHFAFCTV